MWILPSRVLKGVSHVEFRTVWNLNIWGCHRAEFHSNGFKFQRLVQINVLDVTYEISSIYALYSSGATYELTRTSVQKQIGHTQRPSKPHCHVLTTHSTVSPSCKFSKSLFRYPGFFPWQQFRPVRCSALWHWVNSKATHSCTSVYIMHADILQF